MAQSAHVSCTLGGWDMFHSGHMKVLELAKSMGDYLIAGYVGKEFVHVGMHTHEQQLGIWIEIVLNGDDSSLG